MKKELKRFMYVSPSATTYGPIQAVNEKAARKVIRDFWGLKSTRGYYVYEETQEQADEKYNSKREFYKDVLQSNGQLCLTDFD
jgi:hypothetical protein